MGIESMTRDEILAMQPGRELDALVAEKVMGWKTAIMNGFQTYVTDQGAPKPWVDEWNPSTDISAAMEVLDMFKGFEIVKHSYEVKVKVVRTGQMGIAYADSVPLAICRAALLAVMAE